MSDSKIASEKTVRQIEFLVDEFLDDNRFIGDPAKRCEHFERMLKSYMYEAYEEGLKDKKNEKPEGGNG